MACGAALRVLCAKPLRTVFFYLPLFEVLLSMNISQLRCFVEAASTHSLNLAAKNLFLSQPNLSNAINQLENELGVSLFHRSNKGVTLTDEGLELLPYAKSILEEITCLSRFYETRKERKYLRLSCQPMSPVYHALSRSQQVFRESNCSVSVHETDREKIIDDVINNRSDIGILVTSSYDPIRFRDAISANNLGYFELDEKPAMVFFHKASKLAVENEITYKTLKPYCRIIFNIDGYTDVSLELSKTLIRTNSVSLTKELLGDGENYLIQTLWDKDIFMDRDIIARPLLEPSVRIKIGYCYHKGRKESVAVATFMTFLKEQFKTYS